ncbi:hypothetical protein [Streptomyces sp. NBC_01508]
MSETVTEWIGQHAHRLTKTDSRAPLTDLYRWPTSCVMPRS